MNTPIQFQGEEYETLKACCKALGISFGSMCDRRRRARCTTEEAIAYLLEKKKGFVYRGQSYLNIGVCCEALGVKYGSVYAHRRRTGCTTEEAIDWLLEKEKKFVYRGQSYPSVTACCKAVGVTHQSIAYRCRRTGCTTEEAIDHFLAREPEQDFVYNGQSYPSVKACCAELEICYNSVMRYRSRAECTTTDAIDHFLEAKRKVVYKGQSYPSITACCKALGVDRDTVKYYHRSSGCTLEDAIERCLRPANLKLLYTGRTTGKIYYSGTCRTCGRKLLLAEDELAEFAHSDEFCKNHVIPW